MSSTALLTDRYELTMLDAALRAGTAGQPATFEVFSRSLPAGRGYGVVAGVGRLLDALDDFTFSESELEWLGRAGIVSDVTLEWLAAYRFSGDIDSYGEGELYGAGSPVLTVDAPFGEAVLLETLALSILNHDSAVATAASIITRAAAGRPVIEMGSRRTDPDGAVAAARAAYIGGFTSTSNLEAGRRYGVPTTGTAAHAFMLSFADETEAFRAQVAAMGPETTLLVDTFDTERGIRRAIDVAGTGLAAVRIDSGDLAAWAQRARSLLDSLGATDTRVVLTGDLDDRSIRNLRSVPADAYGVGTSVVTGLDHPTAGFIYKLVSIGGRPVAKLSPGKSTVGGRKWAWRVLDPARDVVGLADGPAPAAGRPLQTAIVRAGRRVGRSTLEDARAAHGRSVADLGEAAELTVQFR